MKKKIEILLNSKLDKINTWLSINKLSLHVEKYHLLFAIHHKKSPLNEAFNKLPKPILYTICQNLIVPIDVNLNWKKNSNPKYIWKGL